MRPLGPKLRKRLNHPARAKLTTPCSHRTVLRHPTLLCDLLGLSTAASQEAALESFHGCIPLLGTDQEGKEDWAEKEEKEVVRERRLARRPANLAAREDPGAADQRRDSDFALSSGVLQRFGRWNPSSRTFCIPGLCSFKNPNTFWRC